MRLFDLECATSEEPGPTASAKHDRRTPKQPSSRPGRSAGVKAPGAVATGHGFATVQRIPHAPPSVFPTVVDPWRFWGVPQRFPHHGFRHGVPFAGFGYGPSIGYVVPAVYGYASAGYGSPDVYTRPDVYTPDVYGPTSAVATLSPAMPRVVEYSGGRYELRGDGISVPYVWVRIPNAPLGPPPTPAVPPAPPALEPSGSAPVAERASRAHRTRIYRWTDDQGVVNLTDDLESVPERYRTQARAR